MKLKYLSLALCAGSALCAIASPSAEKLFIYLCSGEVKGLTSSLLNNIEFDEEGNIATFTINNSATGIEIDAIEAMQFEAETDTVTISFAAGGATSVRNPFAFEGIVTETDADGLVTVHAAEGSPRVVYRLTGSTSEGAFKYYGPDDTPVEVILDNAMFTATASPAIDLRPQGEVRLTLVGESVLSDSKSYTLPDNEKASGAIHTEGSLTISGPGSLTLTGLKKHAINAEGAVTVNSGSVTVKSSKSDAIHFGTVCSVSGGSLDLNPKSDAIDGDGIFELSGGAVNAVITENTSKGVKAAGNVTLSGGELNLTLSGGVEVEEGDPSYCSGVKAKSDMQITGGTVVINHSGEAGKGISVDGNLSISGGVIKITTSGDGDVYTDMNNATDSYSSTCIKADGDLTINGTADITCSASGSAGKGINTDGVLTIGSADGGDSPVVNVTTTGEKFLVSSGSSSGGGPGGGRPGGWGPGGGFDDNADYANPKAIKATGNMIVNGGVINVITTCDGGEGLESKDTLTINGGDIELHTYDDAINAANAIVINGGRIYADASGNDGIDSNGTLTINGGVVIASGTSSPEDGFDCDQNQFKITGGVIIGLGGSTSTPTSSVCTQNAAIVNLSATFTKGELWCVCDASGNALAIFTMPKSYNRSATLLFSTPDLKLQSTYTVKRGVSVSGNATQPWCGYYTDGEITGGTTVTTFTQTSAVTGGNSGGRPW